MQEQMALRLVSASSLPQELVRCVLGVIWSCSLSQNLDPRFYNIASHALQQQGRALDARNRIRGRHGTGRRNQTGMELAGWAGRAGRAASAEAARGRFPSVVLDLPEKLLILKPAGWEVYDDSTDAFQLRQYLRHLFQFKVPILEDPDFNYGFLHRLDVPSSGLILAAKSFTAYYGLQAQLASGRLLRHYLAVCHGLQCTRRIEAPLSWLENAKLGGLSGSGLSLTRSGPGKPARTDFKLLRRAFSGPGSRGKMSALSRSSETSARSAFKFLRPFFRSLSLGQIEIGTGRRHQIRSHLSHVGAPVLGDAKYTSQETFDDFDDFGEGDYEGDEGHCKTRTALHRFRLCFQEELGWRNVTALPDPGFEDFLGPFLDTGLSGPERPSDLWDLLEPA
ncbi:rluD [Symbiodinium natans]|uniref:RluD protein n=1 Tax=Symbiodinium natans TaxID=878477 RepID=A0A812MFY7_9DINO|nr:rluD [Symbiodinium natans]